MSLLDIAKKYLITSWSILSAFSICIFAKQMSKTNFFSQNLSSYKLNIWAGFSFENVCFNHIDQIKFALGVSGVGTTSSAYFSKEKGMQIDMALARKDNVINLCEMKFYSDLFKLDKENYLKSQSKGKRHYGESFQKDFYQKYFGNAYGIYKNEYSSILTNVITLDDLFRF